MASYPVIFIFLFHGRRAVKYNSSTSCQSQCGIFFNRKSIPASSFEIFPYYTYRRYRLISTGIQRRKVFFEQDDTYLNLFFWKWFIKSKFQSCTDSCFFTKSREKYILFLTGISIIGRK